MILKSFNMEDCMFQALSKFYGADIAIFIQTHAPHDGDEPIIMYSSQDRKLNISIPSEIAYCDIAYTVFSKFIELFPIDGVTVTDILTEYSKLIGPCLQKYIDERDRTLKGAKFHVS